jgi:hypothetical protein
VTSSFSWLDYSEHERRKMLDVIHLFQEKDTRDELGVGTVRDAFAELLFPGTSTIQTRARYFLFVPWMYLGLERRKVASSVVATREREEETALIDVLARSDDAQGTIGVIARRGLKRLPSNIYWQGLGRWGIRLFPGSQDQYHRSLDLFYSLGERQQRNDDGEPVDGRVARNWHPGLPPMPKDFPRKVSLRLTGGEARYLRERILTRVPKSMLAFLVDEGQSGTPCGFPWEHSRLVDFPHTIREQLGHARNFSETIHGAALLYNLMLSEEVRQQGLIEEYHQRLRDWSSALAERGGELSGWDRRRFWEIVEQGGQNIKLPTRHFVDGWLDLTLSNTGPSEVADDARARRLILDRERQLKRGQARLDNIRARELWNEEAGIRQLSYRWPVAQTIVQDIAAGLSGQGSHA